MSDMRFNRLSLLTGSRQLRKLADTKVIIFGIGGVGSWTAEALARSGIGHITLVDADTVATSNINRQLPALESTVGLPKVEVMSRRLLDINPALDLTAIQQRYTAETASCYNLGDYDFVIDAIDSLADKQLLIVNATAAKTRFFSSMGAALKSDPSRIKVAEFWKVTGCPLAAALRRRFKKSDLRPRRKFKCVYSDELLSNRTDTPADNSGALTFGKVAVNGALCHITAIFGFTLASLVINSVAFARED